jgi:uncharacterized protein (DUF488 family)
MSPHDLLSIGHSNIPAERFRALLQGVGVEAIADVRSTPHSRFCPWFSQKPLAAALSAAAMAIEPEYVTGLDRLLEVAARSRVCLMCAERDPLDCHRCLLVARSLAERGVAVAHILHDGAIEAHIETELRLLALDAKTVSQACDLFTSGQHDRLAAAYRRRARAVAFRRKASAPRNIAER